MELRKAKKLQSIKEKNDNNEAALKWISHVAGRKKIYIVLLMLVQIIIGISSIFYAVFLRGVIDEAVKKNREGFFTWLSFFAILVIFQIAMRAVNRFLEEYSRSSVENCFKERILGFILKKDYAKITEIHSGEWMNRITSDTVVVADGLAQIVPGVVGMIVKMTGALVMILVLYPLFGYILIPGGILLIILTYGFRKVLKRLHKKMQEADGELRVFLQETLSSMLVVRAFGKEEQSLEEAAKKMEYHKKARMKKNHFSNICNAGFGGVMNGAYVVGAGICGYGILVGTMSYGTLMAILQLISQIQSPFANITGYLPKYYAMMASAERLMEIERYDDGSEENVQKCEDICINGGLKSLEEINKFYSEAFEAVVMENLEFTYKSSVKDNKLKNPVVLKNVNLTINKGDYVAFTGPSGCGKSTILKIMMCLYRPDAGKCLLKVKNTQIELTKEFRRLFAYVPQGNHLMSGTIREIIAFGDKAGMKQNDRIDRALSIACADEFVKKLNLGVETVLGERGLGLSEGQMQRIAIARAVFSDNPIIMLDESTSALDEQTEKKLLSNLRNMTDKTVIIVTHRNTVLNICDKEIRFCADKEKCIISDRNLTM